MGLFDQIANERRAEEARRSERAALTTEQRRESDRQARLQAGAEFWGTEVPQTQMDQTNVSNNTNTSTQNLNNPNARLLGNTLVNDSFMHELYKAGLIPEGYNLGNIGDVVSEFVPGGTKYYYGNDTTIGRMMHQLATSRGWEQGYGYIVVPQAELTQPVAEQPIIQTGDKPIIDKPIIIPEQIDTADKIRYALPADMVALLAQRYSIPQQYGTNFLDAANPGNNPLGSVIGAGALQGGIDQLYTALKRAQIANDYSRFTGNKIVRNNGQWYMMQGDMPVALSPAQAWQINLAKVKNTYDSTRTLQGNVNYGYNVNKNITGLPQGGGATTSGSSAGASANANQLQGQVAQSARQMQQQIGR